MKPLRTIILAAGKGTRMKSQTPKVLHTVCGMPILQYVLDVADKVGSLKTYVVVGHQSDAVKEYLGKNYEAVLQRQLLGTADAVRSVQGKLKSFSGDVLILCGDTPLLRREVIKELITLHRTSGAICTSLTAKVENPQGYGRIIRDKFFRASAIREDKDATAEEKAINEINVGVYCVDSKSLLKALSGIKLNPTKKEFYLTDIIELFYKANKKVETLTVDDLYEGLGVNNRVDLATAEKVIRGRILNELMINGVTIVDPDTTYVGQNVKIGEDTIIRPCTVIENDVVIGKNCVIGPFARLRPGTKLADKVEIGNFAEISRTSIGEQTMVKHVGFLGDAVIGKKVNIGAGTITANYDGVNKNKTTIDDEAFIGTDSILVAPVKIGKKSVVGAGSVVTKGKNVPDGKVAVGIPARVIGRRKF